MVQRYPLLVDAAFVIIAWVGVKLLLEFLRAGPRDLPPRHCLVLGGVVKDFPIVAKVRPLNIKTMGQTRLFFTEKKK